MTVTPLDQSSSRSQGEKEASLPPIVSTEDPSFVVMTKKQYDKTFGEKDKQIESLKNEVSSLQE